MIKVSLFLCYNFTESSISSSNKCNIFAIYLFTGSLKGIKRTRNSLIRFLCRLGLTPSRRICAIEIFWIPFFCLWEYIWRNHGFLVCFQFFCQFSNNGGVFLSYIVTLEGVSWKRVQLKNKPMLLILIFKSVLKKGIKIQHFVLILPVILNKFTSRPSIL